MVMRRLPDGVWMPVWRGDSGAEAADELERLEAKAPTCIEHKMVYVKDRQAPRLVRVDASGFDLVNN